MVLFQQALALRLKTDGSDGISRKPLNAVHGDGKNGGFL
ncbi:hypothetical protein SDC9_174082 [bioreactor metagenome]|uniref:Uncharacterized protein n=1 Tax=bioreactor metagenome TaxID=1076179 RepID=A0A645GI89_9ZZZZ